MPASSPLLARDGENEVPTLGGAPHVEQWRWFVLVRNSIVQSIVPKETVQHAVRHPK